MDMANDHENNIVGKDDIETESDHVKSHAQSSSQFLEDNLEVSTGTYTQEENKSLVRKLDWHVSLSPSCTPTGKPQVPGLRVPR